MMDIKTDIQDVNHIKLLVNNFYDKVRNDEFLAPVFNERIKDHWPIHLEKMYSFWQTVLLDSHSYFGAPFPPHINLPINKEHFDRWLLLFKETINENFEGAIADEALWRAEKMALMFQSKLNNYRNSNSLI